MNTTQHDKSPHKNHKKNSNFASVMLLVFLVGVIGIAALTLLGGTVSENFTDIDAGLSDGGVGGGISSNVARGGDAEQAFVPAPAPAQTAPPQTAPPQTAPPTTVASNAEEGLFGLVEIGPDGTDEIIGSTPIDSRFIDYGIRTFIDTGSDPLSTFALDVDTGSYTVARRYLGEGQLPPRESVRVEEYVNFFDYDYVAPDSGLSFGVDGGPSPFGDETYVLRVGVQAAELEADERPPVALTFVVDTSGSMDSPDRLGLVKESLSLLVSQLQPSDTVAIVTYSGDSGVVLEPTAILERNVILSAIDELRAGGSTNLESGLTTGYDLAERAFRDDGVNRVIVASDGLANAGVTSADLLADSIRDSADNGIGLVTVGYGLNGFSDPTMEQLADQGDGFYAYVDNIGEAERLFAADLTSTLITAAVDAKIQVEFNEDIVTQYRLIGYENRAVADEDFRNDEIDAGELGAGHQATAIYEVRLADGVNPSSDAVLGRVNLRWEDPDTRDVNEVSRNVGASQINPNWAETRVDFRQAVVVATFAEVLRDNPFADGVSMETLRNEAWSLADETADYEYNEFAQLVEIASVSP